MLTNAFAFSGYAIAASDGHLGSVHDLLFDDAAWAIRWLVVDTGGWLPGRKLLLPPSALGHPDQGRREFAVRLTREQVKNSPDIDTERPVSRQREAEVYDHYGWSPYWSDGLYPYWGGGLYVGGLGYPIGALATPRNSESDSIEAEILAAERRDNDPHLRSINAVAGYHVHARDGEIGHVEDFLVEDADWTIHYLIIDTKNWWPGKKVLISPRSVRGIDWGDRLISLDVDRQTVRDSPVYDPSTTVDRRFERLFHRHYDDARSSDKP